MLEESPRDDCKQQNSTRSGTLGITVSINSSSCNRRDGSSDTGTYCDRMLTYSLHSSNQQARPTYVPTPSSHSHILIIHIIFSNLHPPTIRIRYRFPYVDRLVGKHGRSQAKGRRYVL